MFGFFGAKGLSAFGVDEAFMRIKERSAVEVQMRRDDAAQLVLGHTGETGTALGAAVDGKRTLLMLGKIHGPFPDDDETLRPCDQSRVAAALLNRYARLGTAFLDNVVGQYALALMDGQDGAVLLASGPHGGPRLFLHEDRGVLFFSTGLMDLAYLLGEQARLDRSLEDFLLGFEFLPEGRTIIKNTATLPTGKLVIWRDGERREQAIKAWSAPAELIRRARSEEQGIVTHALYDAFMDSLRDQLPDGCKVGVLQGGFDSMLITAVLARMGVDVETFTFRYREPGYRQGMVEEFKQLTGVPHCWIEITPDVIDEGFDDFADHFNQPVGQAHYLIASRRAAQVMRDRGITHALTGDGCDGLFLGYPTVFQRARLIQRLAPVRFLVSPLIMLLTSSKWLEKRLGMPYRFARNLARVLARPMPARGHIAACTLDRKSLAFLRREAPKQEKQAEEVLNSLATGLHEVEPLRLAYLGKSRVGLNAAKLEGMIRATGIPFLSPYLHPRMTQVAACIPDDLNRPAEAGSAVTTGKYIFMHMVDDTALLPGRFVHQRKMSPVTAPVDLWYWNELRASMLARLRQLPFDVDGAYARSLVTSKRAERWFRDHVGISRYVCQAASLLATYAAFGGTIERKSVADSSRAEPDAGSPPV